MANDNIFQQYLAPPKSVLEYSAELDQAGIRKQALQENALTLAAGRQRFDDGQQSRQRSEQLRSALLGLPQGATDDQRIQAMRGTATPEGFAAADALDKSLTERRKGAAAAAKDEADTAKTNLARDVALHEFHAQRLATVQTPEDALAWAQEGNTLGIFKQPGQYDRGIAAIQKAAQDPQAFAQWRAAAMQGGQSVTEQLKQQFEQVKQAEQVRQFGVTDGRIRTEGAADRAQQDKNSQRTAASSRYSADSSARSAAATREQAQRHFDVTNGAGGKMTEDQSKATGWLVQAENAWGNLQKTAFDKDGKLTAAAKPGFSDVVAGLPMMGGAGNSLRSAERQKFVQAASSMSEAFLRAATGAGVNFEEAKQKVEELTPVWGEDEDTTKQKFAAIPLYIDSLKVRAGPGAKKAAQVLGTPGAASPAPGGKPSLADIFGK